MTSSELKFVVSQQIAEAIRKWAAARMQPDPYASLSDDSYPVSTLYFDTANHDVFHRRGSFGRSKFRVRNYADPHMVFLERKRRRGRKVAKRRVLLPAAELTALDQRELDPRWPGWWFARRLRLRGLRPVCRIDYVRTARAAMTEAGPARLTLDAALNAGLAGHATETTLVSRILPPGGVIVELKFAGATPRLFKELVEEFTLTLQPFSKYRLAMTLLKADTLDEPALMTASTDHA